MTGAVRSAAEAGSSPGPGAARDAGASAATDSATSPGPHPGTARSAAGTAAPTGAEAAVAAHRAVPTPERHVAAIDLGASSGRVMLGVVSEDRIELVPVHRFDNPLREIDGHLCWDLDGLWAQIRQGLVSAHRAARDRGAPGLDAIGVDSWAVDYALIGPPGRPTGTRHDPEGIGARIGEVVSYRDVHTAGAVELVARRVPADRQFALTGAAQHPFTTLHQLAVDPRIATAPPGSSLLLVPDAIGHLLTGRRRMERTNASSTGMLGIEDGCFVPELLAAAGLRADLLPPLISPGEALGPVCTGLAAELGIGVVPVIAVASHDTASAVAAVPAAGNGTLAFISSGTWSLIGLELAGPVATPEARAAGFSNEAGTDGTVRFLKNVSGMWLVGESIRQWTEDGLDVELDGLLQEASGRGSSRWRIDPTDSLFLPPGRMADRVLAAARPAADGPADPVRGDLRDPASVVRCILESLAETYRDELAAACRIARVAPPVRLHVVGGGSRNDLLNELTARATGIEVHAGPVEATALGNVAVQAAALSGGPRGAGAVRALVRAGCTPRVFSPRSRPAAPASA